MLVGLHRCPGLCSSKPSLPRAVTWSFPLLTSMLRQHWAANPWIFANATSSVLALFYTGKCLLSISLHYFKPQQACHKPQLLVLSNVSTLMYRWWFPGCSWWNPNALSESLEYMVLSSWEMLPGLFRISVLRTLVFPLMCLVAHPVLSISMCYLLAIPYASIILLWMVICFAGQRLSPEISDFSRGP